jgi:phage terminase large subunit-like protein
MIQWGMCADEALKIEEFEGDECWFVLDLASKNDICAFVQLFKRQLNGVDHYYAFGRYYLPEDTIEEAKTNQALYRKWVIQGHLIATDGAEIDFDVIREDVKQLSSRFHVNEVAYDPWRATQLAHQLAKDGATVVEFRQTVQNMSPAMKELAAAVMTATRLLRGWFRTSSPKKTRKRTFTRVRTGQSKRLTARLR